MKQLTIRISDEDYEAIKAEAEKLNVTVSNVARKRLNIEIDRTIDPNTLDGVRDKDLLTTMAVSELIPNSIMDLSEEILKHVTSAKKRRTIEWIRDRYAFIYASTKKVNDQFIEYIDVEDATIIGDIFLAFANFISSVKKTKENVKAFQKVCGVKE